MKRYGHLYEKVCELDNLWVAYHNAKRGKSSFRHVREFAPVADQQIPRLHEQLLAREYKTSNYKVFQLIEREKLRTIHALPFYPDRIVHHAIAQVCAPIWERSLIRNTFAALPGRGIHDAVRRIKRVTLGSSNLYVLKMDVKQFYPSVDHDILKQVIRRQIKDKFLLEMLDEIIDSGPGIPIGNYLSQYFGNIVLSPVDHHVTSGLGVKHYFRYCDDIVILHPSKQKLHWLRLEVQSALYDLKLQLKSSWQVFPIDQRGLDFVGYRFWPTHTLVRKKTIKRLRYRMKVKRPTLNEAMRVLHAAKSFRGWLRYADTVKLRKTVTDPAVGKVYEYARRFRTRQAKHPAL